MTTVTTQQPHQLGTPPVPVDRDKRVIIKSSPEPGEGPAGIWALVHGISSPACVAKTGGQEHLSCHGPSLSILS
ncbi:hypothetical protein PoB_001818400 [Plakobranchus ocellatus]|uniref:Uncharacterized protein n=1 Tax=Plakobranchus ocellatus TaxID=259542 RepID=A0AAV3Z8N8_9GAST|nr:hypothetical protein PoB_001818400 [Plakobranchus ocellatus]